MTHDGFPEFGELAFSSLIGVLVVSAHGNALLVRILQVAKVVFCFALSIEPFPPFVDVVLLLAYVDLPRDVVGRQFLSSVALASGLGGPATSPFDPSLCYRYSRCLLSIPLLLVEILMSGKLRLLGAPMGAHCACVDDEAWVILIHFYTQSAVMLVILEFFKALSFSRAFRRSAGVPAIALRRSSQC